MKGDYSNATQYSVGDLVRFNDGMWYTLVKAAPAGTPPTNTLYWQKQPAEIRFLMSLINDTVAVVAAAAADLDDALDKLDGRVDDLEEADTSLDERLDTIEGQLNDKVLLLNSSTVESEKQFAITVDDEGDLAATEVTPPESEETPEGTEET